MDDQDSNGAATALDLTEPAVESAAEPADSMTGGPDNDAGRPNPTQTFLAELARAMQLAADQERERIAAVMTEAAAAHVERAYTRAAAETEELRRMADEDVERIGTWSDAEIARIRAEATRRTDERRGDLEEYLRQHDAIIASEVEAVEAAVVDYRATLDAYFGELAASSDPALIAARAGSLPTPPDLDTVRAQARSSAVARYADTPSRSPRDDDAPGVVDSDPVGDEAELASEDTAAEPVGEVAAEPVGEVAADGPDASESAPDVDAVAVPVAGDGAADETGEMSPAVRLLRSMAPWTAPRTNGEPHDTPPDSH